MDRTLGEMLDDPQGFQTWLHDIAAYEAVMHAVATSKLLDQWQAEPVCLRDLARSSGLDEAQLGRLIDMLASQGVLEIQPDGRIAHTQRSRTLQSFRPATMVHRLALQSGMCLGEAIATGRTAFETRFGKPVFQFFAENPEQADFFGQRMSQITVQDEPLILAQLRFAPFRLAVDIGGSHGTLLAGLLAGHPQARGVVFDLPDVIGRTAARLRTIPQGDRIEAVGGDFFESVPAGGDVYLIKQILHNWDDAQCITILKSVRAAIAPGGRIAVIDRLLPEAITPDPAFMFDVLMMMWTNGRERRLSQIQGLLSSAGFALDAVTRNPGRMSVVEAVPV